MGFTRRELLQEGFVGGLGLLGAACSNREHVPIIPTVTTAPVPPTPIPAPTTVEKEIEKVPRKIWERNVGKSEIGNVNWYDPIPPSFFWTGKKLFINGPGGQVQQIGLDGKNGEFEWIQNGYLLGADRGVIYLTDSQGSRLAIVSDKNYFELPGVTPVMDFLRTSVKDDKTRAADFKWPMFKTPLLAAFQLENGFYAIRYGDRLKMIQEKGQVMEVSGDKMLLAASRSPRGSREWGLYDTTRNLYRWKPAWEGPVHTLADQELLVFSYPSKVSTHGFYAEAINMDNGDFLWYQATPFARPLFLSKDFAVLGERGDTFSYFWFLDKKEGRVVEKLTGLGPEDTYYFFDDDSGKVLFAGSRARGTIAYHIKEVVKDGKIERKFEILWENPELLGATREVSTVGNDFILVREGETGQKQKRMDAKAWIVNKQDGKIVFPPVDLSGPLNSFVLVGTKQFLATGIKGEKCSLVMLDTAIGKATEVEGLNLREPLLHLTAIGTNGVLGQSGTRLLAIKVS